MGKRLARIAQCAECSEDLVYIRSAESFLSRTWRQPRPWACSSRNANATRTRCASACSPPWPCSPSEGCGCQRDSCQRQPWSLRLGSGLESKDYLDSAYGFGPALADAEREGQLGASEIQSPGAELSSASGIPSFDASILDLTPDPTFDASILDLTPDPELIEDRHGLRATLIASQLPVEHWHELIGEATLADAILDRLLHNAHRLTLTGESMRRSTAPSESPVS